MSKQKMSISFELTPMSVELTSGSVVNIYGLSWLKTNPKSKGLGRAALSSILHIQARDCKYAVVGFANDDVVGFYRKCDWYIGPKHTDKISGKTKTLVASIDIGDIVQKHSYLW